MSIRQETQIKRKRSTHGTYLDILCKGPILAFDQIPADVPTRIEEVRLGDQISYGSITPRSIRFVLSSQHPPRHRLRCTQRQQLISRDLARVISELVGVARYWHGLAGVARGSMARESFVHGWSGLRGLEPATPCHEAMNEAMKP
jgi:hypothetical protein